jgi:hypothetical protein
VSAEDTMRLLLRHFRQFRDDGMSDQKPVFWIGAGCSVHDGVPLNAELLRLALPDEPDAWGSPQFRFDQFCELLGSGMPRLRFLKEHVERTISDDSPYHGLVRVLEAGYADLVFSFNIDNLMEQAFEQAGLREGRDYLVVKVPELVSQAAVLQITSPAGPRIRLIKLHGGYEWGVNLMTSSEIVGYDAIILKAVKEYSGRPAVVCGYSFFHLNVLEAFSRDGGSLYYVNRSFPDAPMVLSLMAARSRSPLYVDGELGTFTSFASRLAEELVP